MSLERNTIYFIGDSGAVLSLFDKQPKKPDVNSGWKIVFGSYQNEIIRLRLFSTALDSLDGDENRYQEIDKADVVFLVSSTPAQLKEMVEIFAQGSSGRFAQKIFYFYGIKKEEVDQAFLNNLNQLCGRNNFRIIFDKADLDETLEKVRREDKGAHHIANPGFVLPAEPVSHFKPPHQTSKSCCKKYNVQLFASAVTGVAALASTGLLLAKVLPPHMFIIGGTAVLLFAAVLLLIMSAVNRHEAKNAELKNQRLLTAH